MTAVLSSKQQAVLWACSDAALSATAIWTALNSRGASRAIAAGELPYLGIWPRSEQGIHTTAASLVRQGLLVKELLHGVVHYRRA